MTPGVDFEVYADVWMMFDGYESIKSGHARTRIGRAVAMWRAKRAYLRGAR
jgi:hypothetical protein